MSTNDIGNISQRLKQMQQQQSTQASQDDGSTIDVFSTGDVGAKVSLVADENNSLFTKTNLIQDNKQLENKPTDVSKDTPLPKEFEKYAGNPKDVAALKALTPEQLEKAKQFTSTKMLAQNIAQVVQIFDKDQCAKVKQKVDDITEYIGGDKNTFAVVLGRDKYDTKSFNLNALGLTFNLTTEILDENLDVRSIEKTEEFQTKEGDKYRMQEAYDLKNNTISKTRYEFDKDSKMPYVTYEIRSKIKDDGTMISREYTRPSNVEGVRTVDILTEDGLKEVSSAKQKKNGKVKVQKDMESLDGTRTQYKYKDDPKGDRYLRYKITDKEGKVLMDNKKTFTVVSDNEFKSTFNDKSYTMKIADNKLTVVDDKDEKRTATFDLGEVKGDSEKLIKTLKHLSGDELLEMSETVKNFEGMTNGLESYFNGVDKSLHSGDNLFIVLHELGHAKDFKNVDATNNITIYKTIDNLISQNKDLLDIYNSEKSAFTEAFPEAQREHVDYFTNALTHYGGPSGGVKETVAEGNAIHTTPMTHELLSLRTQYLQQYFPRTMAKLNELYQSNVKKDLSQASKPFKLELPKFELPKMEYPKGN